MKLSVIGIDVGKNVLHVHGADAQGKSVLRKTFGRGALVEWLAQQAPCLIGMEACGGAHHLARVLIDCGHTVRLIHPSFVKAYVKSNKNDFRDAEAIAEAVTRPTMRFVAIKTVAQQELQALHRLRSGAVTQRTAEATGDKRHRGGRRQQDGPRDLGHTGQGRGLSTRRLKSHSPR